MVMSYEVRSSSSSRSIVLSAAHDLKAPQDIQILRRQQANQDYY